MGAVLVTGAASGIGRATALAVASAGESVVLWDLQDDALAECAADCERIGVGVVHKALDVADPEARSAALTHAASLGPITGFVHAAGVSGAQPVSAFTPEGWDFVMRINLDAAAALTRELHPMMRDAGGGAIVYLSSIEGFFGHAWLPAYCSSKAALLGLARSAAHELGADNIRVNCVCPGAIDTPMMAPVLAIDEVRASLEARTPLLRLGQPEDIADVICFLLSNQARFVTGASLIVDGGLTAIAGI